jgi:peptide/nickel transport system ATP-binding protein
MTDAPLLSLTDLCVTFPTPAGAEFQAVRNVSFDVGREKVGIVGESGSGKSLTAKSLLGLIPAPGRARFDRMTFDGATLTQSDQAAFGALRGKRITMIMQDPKFSLNPVMPVGRQIAETLVRHKNLSKADALAAAIRALGDAQIQDPERVAKLHAHQISGGMGQRVMIAMMMAPEPDLLIADEPTSALDVTTRAQILNLIDELRARTDTSVLFISHDLPLVSKFCDRILVMYQGEIVEEIAAAKLNQSTHPYTRALLNSRPGFGDARQRLPTLDRAALARAVLESGAP